MVDVLRDNEKSRLLDSRSPRYGFKLQGNWTPELDLDLASPRRFLDLSLLA
jgi:hypothetical protein